MPGIVDVHLLPDVARCLLVPPSSQFSLSSPSQYTFSTFPRSGQQTTNALESKRQPPTIKVQRCVKNKNIESKEQMSGLVVTRDSFEVASQRDYYVAPFLSSDRTLRSVVIIDIHIPTQPCILDALPYCQFRDVTWSLSRESRAISHLNDLAAVRRVALKFENKKYSIPRHTQ
jgi:hypothetical protein